MIINSGHLDLNKNRSTAVAENKGSYTTLNSDVIKPTRIAKVLLLGAAESGKSTLLRQIRLIHGHSFSSDEMLQFKHNIRSSCLEYFALLVSETVPIQQTTSEWKELCAKFLNRLAANRVLNRELLDAAITLWRDSIVQEYLVEIDSKKHTQETQNTGPSSSEGAYGRNKKLRFYLDDPAYHFLPSLDRILSRGYYPTPSDILTLRYPTTGNHATLKLANIVMRT